MNLTRVLYVVEMGYGNENNWFFYGSCLQELYVLARALAHTHGTVEEEGVQSPLWS